MENNNESFDLLLHVTDKGLESSVRDLFVLYPDTMSVDLIEDEVDEFGTNVLHHSGKSGHLGVLRFFE